MRTGLTRHALCGMPFFLSFQHLDFTTPNKMLGFHALRIDWNPTIPEEMTRFLLLAILTVVIGACSKHRDEKWTALQDMPAFAEPNDDRTVPIFMVKKGEACVPLADRVAKIYAYTQVHCESGTGWVLDDFFDKHGGK